MTSTPLPRSLVPGTPSTVVGVPHRLERPLPILVLPTPRDPIPPPHGRVITTSQKPKPEDRVRPVTDQTPNPSRENDGRPTSGLSSVLLPGPLPPKEDTWRTPERAPSTSPTYRLTEVHGTLGRPTSRDVLFGYGPTTPSTSRDLTPRTRPPSPDSGSWTRPGTQSESQKFSWNRTSGKTSGHPSTMAGVTCLSLRHPTSSRVKKVTD